MHLFKINNAVRSVYTSLRMPYTERNIIKPSFFKAIVTLI